MNLYFYNDLRVALRDIVKKKLLTCGDDDDKAKYLYGLFFCHKEDIYTQLLPNIVVYSVLAIKNPILPITVTLYVFLETHAIIFSQQEKISTISSKSIIAIDPLSRRTKLLPRIISF